VTTHLRDRLGRFGIWRSGSQVTAQLAAGIEQEGFGALWIGGSPSGDLCQIEELLAATTSMLVGTSIVNIWKDDPHTVARSFARLEARFPGRFVLGAGTGHPEATSQYQRPYDAISGYRQGTGQALSRHGQLHEQPAQAGLVRGRRER
jgi:probable F420-dependent oxidoreductase